MSIFQKLLAFFRTPAGGDDYSYRFTVQCSRCGEQITGRVNLRSELSPEFDDSDRADGYTCRKVLSGDGKNYCFQPIEVLFKFDAAHRLLEKTVSGGSFVDSD
ncbi:MAG: hypothetical protein ACOYYS_12260 [Chloroflexota bacterium]